jgi:peptide/nickel transport system substrate-binding protein
MNPRNNTKTRNGWDDVAAIDVPDRYTVVVHLKQPNSAILAGLFGGGGGSSYPPLPEHLLGRLPDLNHADFNRRPISSGPWLLKTWTHGAALTFTPNATYWRGGPKLHELQWKIVPNDETLLTQLQTHDIDVYDPVPENQLGQLAAIPGITTATRLVANWRHLDMNVRNPILRDVRVRRAIAQAVDWDRMNATIYHGVHERATSDIVPDSWAAPHIPLWHFDPAAARQLLAAAGWMPGPGGIRRKNGASLELVISSGTNRPASEAAEVQIQQQLHAVGIDLRIKNYPVSYLFAPSGPLYGGTYDLSWSVDTNGPEPDNSGYWSARFIPPHGANTSFIDDPVLTQTSEAALATFDHAKRKALYQREEERIHELVPTVALYWERSTVAYNSDLRNYVPAEYDMAAMWNSYAWDI